MCKIYMML